MEHEYYIIKRMAWDYDKLPDYYTGLKFTRDLQCIKIFNSIDQAVNTIPIIKKSDPESKNYTFSVIRM